MLFNVTMLVVPTTFRPEMLAVVVMLAKGIMMVSKKKVVLEELDVRAPETVRSERTLRVVTFSAPIFAVAMLAVVTLALTRFASVRTVKLVTLPVAMFEVTTFSVVILAVAIFPVVTLALTRLASV